MLRAAMRLSGFDRRGLAGVRGCQSRKAESALLAMLLRVLNDPTGEGHDYEHGEA